MEVVVNRRSMHNTFKTDKGHLALMMSMSLIALQGKKYESKKRDIKIMFTNFLDTNIPDWRKDSDYRFLL